MKIISKFRVSVLMYMISLIMLGVMFVCCFSGSIIADEAFSLKLIQHPWAEMISLAAGDVHPPLYYVLLKLIVELFGISTIYAEIVAGKIVSVIPFCLLWIISIVFIRKKYGELSGSLFSVLIIGMPSMIHTASLVRMYSWSAFFVILAYLIIYGMIIDDDFSVKVWMKLTIVTILACYTHYYAIIAMVGLYLFLLIYLLCQKRKLLVSYVISSLFVMVSFIPWGQILIKQMNKISANYWIPEISVKTCSDIGEFYFRPYISLHILNMAFLIILIAVVIKVWADAIRQKGKACLPEFCGMGNIFFVVLVSVIISKLYRPILVGRYLLPSMGCFWLSFSLLAGRNATDHGKNLRNVMISFFMLISIIDVSSYAKNEYVYSQKYNEIEEFLNQRSESLILTDDEYIQQCLALYTDQAVYGVNVDESENFKSIFTNMKDIDLKSLSDQKQKIVMFVSEENEEESIKRILGSSEIEKTGFQIEQHHVTACYIKQ